jgi:hypothetical protein
MARVLVKVARFAPLSAAFSAQYVALCVTGCAGGSSAPPPPPVLSVSLSSSSASVHTDWPWYTVHFWQTRHLRIEAELAHFFLDFLLRSGILFLR